MVSAAAAHVVLTLESGAPRQALGAFLLFVTNVAAILARASWSWPSTESTGPSGPRAPVTAPLIAVLLLVVIVALRINSEQIDKTSVRQSEVQAVAERWANDAG